MTYFAIYKLWLSKESVGSTPLLTEDIFCDFIDDRIIHFNKCQLNILFHLSKFWDLYFLTENFIILLIKI